MGNSLYHTLNISRHDLLNRMMDLDTISNNLANVNTVGFRSSRMNFQELFNSQYLEGSTVNGSQTLTRQGVLQTTDNPFDWAIQGDGFFPVKLPNGETGYTRDGIFSLDGQRQLVNSSGYVLDWDGQIPETTTGISISKTGEVTALLEDDTSQMIGNVELARFANPSALISAGTNVWIPGDATGEAEMVQPGTEGMGFVQSYAYERSNVNMTEEMTRLIQVQRGFQMSARVLQQTDTMINLAIHVRKA